MSMTRGKEEKVQYRVILYITNPDVNEQVLSGDMSPSERRPPRLGWLMKKYLDFYTNINKKQPDPRKHRRAYLVLEQYKDNKWKKINRWNASLQVNHLAVIGDRQR
jgi:hypothetical protein